ncbi:SDR family NAD(P)-dependent oxidoreductase [Novosphingobium sp. Chol11]|uniref:SDR family NAD(P)-dependent oxidoreductase n=1 Tax=Novosphingobium sp. Chol11 TaxID=1385763 RepID=UPI000BE38B33|nr:SDR family NAD(P)-dependent oxidoreductase [Novosphingobium sp. Chol11]
MDRFEKRIAVVTGGASGIGFALAERLLDEGMKVVIADIDSDALDRAVAALADKGDIIGHRTDVSNPDSLQSLADTAVARFGAVHLLCNNAGVGGFQRFGSLTREAWEWVIGVDLWGPIHGCRIFMPILQQQDEAHIVNTASMSGFVYGPYLQPYSVAKAGVVALTESLYREFEKEGSHIGVSVLCPAFTATAISNDERSAPSSVARRGDLDPDLAPVRDAVRDMMAAGKTAAEVADITVQGIRERKLHIFPHPSWLAAVEQRMKNILAGEPVGDEPASVLVDPRT